MAMTGRQKQALATKQRILETAERLIGERGYEAVSVDDIVADCAVAKGTFYHYFKAKDELMVYLTFTPYEHMEKNAEKNRSLPFLRRLRAFLGDWFDMVDKFNLNFSRQSIKRYADPAVRGEYGGNVSQMDLGMDILRACFEDGVRQGELRPDAPVETLTRAMMFSMQGCTIYQCKYPDSFDVGAWGREFTRFAQDVIIAPFLTEEGRQAG